MTILCTVMWKIITEWCVIHARSHCQRLENPHRDRNNRYFIPLLFHKQNFISTINASDFSLNHCIILPTSPVEIAKVLKSLNANKKS